MWAVILEGAGLGVFARGGEVGACRMRMGICGLVRFVCRDGRG